MILDRGSDVATFLSSQCDLAVAKMNYRDDLSHSIDRWLAESVPEFELSFKSCEEIEQKLPAKAFRVWQPFQSLLRQLQASLGSTQHRLLMKSIHDQMCPIFHVDNILLRFLVTLRGPGTQWLSDRDVNRKNLGKMGRKPIAREHSFLQQLQTGQIGLLKGAKFPQSQGLVHRSPPVDPENPVGRFFLRVDFLHR